MARQEVGLILLDPRSVRGREGRERLAGVLGEDSLDEPDETGVFEARVDAPDRESALQRVWDAIAEAGADDHIAFVEHPELPQHWRHRAASPTL
jgi:hypothetical protein